MDVNEEDLNSVKATVHKFLTDITESNSYLSSSDVNLSQFQLALWIQPLEGEPDLVVEIEVTGASVAYLQTIENNLSLALEAFGWRCSLIVRQYPDVVTIVVWYGTGIATWEQYMASETHFSQEAQALPADTASNLPTIDTTSYSLPTEAPSSISPSESACTLQSTHPATNPISVSKAEDGPMLDQETFLPTMEKVLSLGDPTDTDVATCQVSTPSVDGAPSSLSHEDTAKLNLTAADEEAQNHLTTPPEPDDAEDPYTPEELDEGFSLIEALPIHNSPPDRCPFDAVMSSSTNTTVNASVASDEHSLVEEIVAPGAEAECDAFSHCKILVLAIILYVWALIIGSILLCVALSHLPRRVTDAYESSKKD
ncbi:hypothetical protein DXG01_003999 [Tephrocybe rancida]|nr:hypothetical protein DXG01_003999 [Tephrocybe rancida]